MLSPFQGLSRTALKVEAFRFLSLLLPSSFLSVITKRDHRVYLGCSSRG